MIANKKGFTLVEVLAVVVVIGLLAGVSIPVVSKYVNNGKKEYNEKLEKEFLNIVKDYYADNQIEIPKGKNGSDFSDAIYLTKLYANNYLSDEMKDAEGGSCYNSVGYALYEKGKTTYYACLVCDNYIGKMYEDNELKCSDFGTYNECKDSSGFVVEDIKYTFDGVQYDGDWTNKNVVVEVVLRENVNIILKINEKTFVPTKIDGLKYTFVVDKDVNGEVLIYDKCGNSNSTGDVIKIDKTDPEITIAGNKVFVLEPNSDVLVTHIVDIKDAGEIKNISYKCNNSACDSLGVSDNNVTYKVDESGSYIFTVSATDEAGNTSSKDFDYIVKNKIIYDLNGGSGTFSNVLKEKNKSVTISSVVPNKIGYTFGNWKALNGNIYSAGGIYNENISTKLTAMWNPKIVTVKFVCSDTLSYTQKYTYGVSDQKFTNSCSLRGYVQVGWAEKKNSTAADYSLNSNVDSDWIEKKYPNVVELYPVFTPVKVNVKFVCSNSLSYARTYTYGIKDQKFTDSCSNYGYNQNGWSRTSSGVKVHEKNASVSDEWIVNNASSEEVLLYPTWEAKYVDVKYVCSASNTYLQRYYYGTSNQKYSYTCSVLGYNHLGWAESSGSTSVKWTTSSLVNDEWIVSNASNVVSLYAVLKIEKTEVEHVTIKFQCRNATNNANINESYTYTYYVGKSNQRFSDGCSLITGYNNVGWVDSDGTRRNLGINVTDNWIKQRNGQTITMWSVREPKKVTVTFKCPTGDKVQTFTYGVDNQKFNSTCSSTGLSQKGWATTENGAYAYTTYCGVQPYWINNNASKNIILYPVWHLVSTPTSKCSYDKTPPVCTLLESCHESSDGEGVRAGFKCTDASDFSMYYIFAEQGWQASKFSSVDNIKDELLYVDGGKVFDGGTIGTKYSTWNQSYSGYKPVRNHVYTFYFAAIDECNNRVVYDNVTNYCYYN